MNVESVDDFRSLTTNASQALLDSKMLKALIDLRSIEILHSYEAILALVSNYFEDAPLGEYMCVAVVAKEEHKLLGEFWEAAAQFKGYANFRFFLDSSAAADWLEMGC